MQLVPRDSFSGLIDSLFNAGNLEIAEFNGFFTPSVDIEEHDDGYLLKADLPGVRKEDISVTLENGILTLSAERSEEKEDKSKGKVIRRERRSGSYTRSFSVGDGVSEEDIQASFNDGVLTIKMPKPREAKSGTRRIAID